MSIDDAVDASCGGRTGLVGLCGPGRGLEFDMG